MKDISLVANVRQLDTITVEVAAEAIRARKIDGPKLTLIPIEDIQSEVGKFYNVTVKEIKATKRTQNIVLARQVAMYLAREMTDNSFQKLEKNLEEEITQLFYMLTIKSKICLLKMTVYALKLIPLKTR